MFTRVFKDRSAKDRITNKDAPRDLAAAEQALADLLTSRDVRGYALARHCELGPFLVDYLFTERALIVELAPDALAPESPHAQERLKFLRDLGYDLLTVSPTEVVRHPVRVLAKLRAVLESR